MMDNIIIFYYLNIYYTYFLTKMTFQKGNLGGRLKMSYRTKIIRPEKTKKIIKKESLNSTINKFLRVNFISNCHVFCKLCMTSKKCPYICDYCNGHKVCKEMCCLPKLTKSNLLIHNNIILNHKIKININNNDLLDILPDLTDFINSL
jgi:hypothetical protein